MLAPGENSCVSPRHSALSTRSPVACGVENYKRLFLNKTQLSSAEDILQSSTQCKIFFVFFFLSRLYARLFRRSNEQYRSSISILSPSSNPILHNQRNLFSWLRSFSELVASISWSTAIRARDSSLLRKLLIGNSRSSFEIPFGQGIFADAAPRADNSELSCHLRTSPHTQGMVSHRHKTFLSSRLFLSSLLLKSKVKVLIAMILSSHFSQCLFSESSEMSPNFLNHCVIYQNLVEHVDDQKRFQEYSYSLVYFAAFQLRG